ncbi:MAG: type VI secretion system membrane subunit TssM [Polaromonas sp.]|uniref:type VI secretion system membrane subunit TssM n=1 Tax=Polaromonas sp. TaxID=1869339 RepID=UPI0017E66C7D|nr:type VI secretion system membrane subunit TssM [Polaromonas sp.]NMM08667.1 type VI secretion system membrane subunit TssM [Polaromonas sp.]
MQRFWQFLTDRRTLIVIGFVALAAFLLLGLRAVEVAAIWAFAIFVGAVMIGVIVWWVRRRKAEKASRQLGDMLEAQAVGSSAKGNKNMRAEEVELLRKRMLEAVKKIKTSKLGETSGIAALYELPWYMVIGNPAAGKSTAIANSGLQFPLADKTGKVIHGVGGTRNCDWFFTSDGIVLDTAGRYSVHDEDLDEWFGFLSLLKKHRPTAPINGIIIAASIGELIGNRPEFGITLAKNLRQRVQELTERLEVFAPIYVVFTKADLISGFTDFFQETNRTERDRVWGATLPYAPSGTGQDAAKLFDKHFDELYDGLREMSLANMALNQDEDKTTALLTFPLEFASIKSSLRAFILTLFEENPFQFKPVFRGFYFTSALQDGASASTSSERVAERFSLKLRETEVSTVTSKYGFFLHDLFRNVIFADKALVARFASRAKKRLRYIAFIGATAALALSLTAWSWSYVNNRRLIENVQADLDKVVRLQDKRLDLQSRMEALEILQDRIEQLEQYRQNRPFSLSMGLYKGDLLEQKLRTEYFAGIKEVMLKPVAGNLEAFLSEVVAGGDKLAPMGSPPQTPVALGDAAVAPRVATKESGGLTAYKDSSPANAEDAYNALKTYLMLADKSRVESGHLNDQLARFWRGWLESNRAAMPREQMIRSAERLISFFLSQVSDPSWPAIENKLTLVDQSRDTLRRVVRGMPARDRVYADVKARASTRFPPMTVARIVGDQDKDLISGSYAIAGTFTREAWEKYVEEAIKVAANKELQSEDWVLKTAARDDLTLEGSPEQIQKALVAQYKAEYAKEWLKFIAGVTATELTNFDQTVTAMNKFGDPQNSPISKLINTVYEQTSWDNPSLINEGIKRAQQGVVGWFKETILRQTPSGMNVNLNLAGTPGQTPVGPVGTEFAGVARLVVVKDKDASLMRGYMETLSKLRTRFNQIKNQGDSGPGAKQLMQQTLEGSGSELSDSLKFVDEQMMVGMTDTQRKAIRPILVRPLVQAFSVVVKPTESELNKTWLAQVYDPFQKTLGSKYPFVLDSKIEATSSEIGQFFGAEGAIAKFVTTAMGPLVVRRGDTLTAKTWADMGINLAPEVVSSFPSWVAPLSAGGVAASSGTDAQTVFQIQPLPATGVTEYTVDIDGQQLRYRNTQAQWVNFVWPNPQGAPGARVVATTFDGRTVEMVNFPGRFGLEKLIGSAQRKRKDNGVFELTWVNGAATVSIDLKIISSPQAGTGGSAPSQSQGYRGMRLPTTVTQAAPVAAASPVASVQGSVSTTAVVGAGK